MENAIIARMPKLKCKNFICEGDAGGHPGVHRPGGAAVPPEQERVPRGGVRLLVTGHPRLRDVLRQHALLRPGRQCDQHLLQHYVT